LGWWFTTQSADVKAMTIRLNAHEVAFQEVKTWREERKGIAEADHHKLNEVELQMRSHNEQLAQLIQAMKDLTQASKSMADTQTDLRMGLIRLEAQLGRVKGQGSR